jgi:streptomycin 6-kinase
MVAVPSGLEWWRGEPGGAAWLERLPRLVEECAKRWSLTLEHPFEPAHISFVCPARVADGRSAVLKINFPEPESEHEADALVHYAGRAAVFLLEHDPARRALLVERCEPGTTLWTLSDEEGANRIAAQILLGLWRPAPADHPYRLLADEAARWAEDLPRRWEASGRLFERALLDRAVTACRELGPDQGEQVVLHQDFHGGNVLRSQREPWLAIDPKPLVGEREFDCASLLRDRREPELASDPHPAARIRRRLDQLSSDLELDRERLRGWGIAHALAWGVSAEGVDEGHVACARWLAAA